MNTCQQVSSSQTNLWLTLEGEQTMCGCWCMHGSNDFHSSFTWIGNKQAYVPTNTSQITRNQVVSTGASVFMRYICVLSHLNRQEFTSIYGNTKFSGKFLLPVGLPTRHELNGYRKHRFRGRRQSYHWFRYLLSIVRCCFGSRLL